MAYHHGNLRESLLQAGSEELKTIGVEGVSLREVAKRAGVSHNAPYRHFRDKVDFIQQIVERSLNELAEQILNAPLLYPVSIVMQLQYVGRLFAQLAIRHPSKAHLIFTGLTADSARPLALGAGHRLIRQNMASLIESSRGHEIKTDTDSDLLALLLLGTFRGLGSIFTSGAESDLFAAEEDLYGVFDQAVENNLRFFLETT